MTTASATQFLDTLRITSFSGDIQSDWASRIVWSTDNSIYQLIPDGIIFPKTTHDVSLVTQLLHHPEWRHISISPRGGGTGTNGQSLTNGLILDTSRYMNQIIEINLHEQWVRVQPGVVLDQLNMALAPDQLVFVPNVAPSNRATIGGMISTDASGKGSRVYGKTSQHVLELTGVMMNGECIRIAKNHPSPIDDLLHTISQEDTDDIKRHFPDIPRFLSGYNLKHATDNGINPIPIIAGSEGTLVIITEAKLALLPKKSVSHLIVIQYPSLTEAIDHAQHLIQFNPIAIETVDQVILELGKTDSVSDPIREWIHPHAGAMNLIDIEHPDALLRLLDATPPLSLRQVPSAEARHWWGLRKKAVGLLANQPGPAKPIPFIEDTAVPPAQMGHYIQELRQLLDRHHLTYAMYGHADAGCIHVRPAMDLQNPAHEALIPILTEEVYQLVTRFGGVLWGEHGKGFRNGYIQTVFGPHLTQRLQAIKTRFDPYNQLNPGKIVGPIGTPLPTPTTPIPLRAHFDRDIPQSVQNEHLPIMACNGNGDCFSTLPNTLMCPSYLASMDRIQSPKGRAMIFKEWLRRDKDPQLSDAVYQALSGCLSCKACVTDCPVHINIPKIKSDFLFDYFKSHPRRLRDYLIAHVETLSQWASRFWILRLASAIPIWRRMGLVDLPTIQARIRPKQNLTPPKVIIAIDALSDSYTPQLGIAAHKILTAMGFSPLMTYLPPTGKSAYIKGFKFLFNAQANRLIQHLTQLPDLPILMIEPGVMSLFEDEYAEIVNRPVVSPIAHFLATHAHRIPIKTANPDPITILLHCMERNGPNRTQPAWETLFNTLGIPTIFPEVGCCGMAGIFGHEIENQLQSNHIFNLSWQQKLPKHTVAVTGYSCRHQVKRFSNTPTLHPLEMIANAL